MDHHICIYSSRLPVSNIDGLPYMYIFVSLASIQHRWTTKSIQILILKLKWALLGRMDHITQWIFFSVLLIIKKNAFSVIFVMFPWILMTLFVNVKGANKWDIIQFSSVIIFLSQKYSTKTFLTQRHTQRTELGSVPWVVCLSAITTRRVTH